MVKIFVGNIPSDCARRDVMELFDKYGKVKDCDIIRNFAFVHMENDEEARDAIDKLDKSTFMGNDITVEESTSRPRNTYKIYVGNLSSNASRRELQKLFEQYGEVVECDIIKDFAFCHMTKERDAQTAIRELHNSTFSGRRINVELSRNDRDRNRYDRRGGSGGGGGGGTNTRAYREYYDRWYEYYYGRGGSGGNYNQGGGGGYSGRYNNHHNNRYRSPIRRNRYSRSKSRSKSKSYSRSRSRSPTPRDRSRNRRKNESRSPTPESDRGSRNSSRSLSRE